MNDLVPLNLNQHLAVIIGAMRCGTTSLFQWLCQHPQISKAIDKEPGFFSNEVVWNRGIEWYKNLWNWDSSTHRIALEASVNYSKVALFPDAAQRLASVAPDAKLIYLMRNPIERIESQYTLGKAKGWRESIKPLANSVHDDLLECSRYAKQLDQYRAIFPDSSILLLRSEDMYENPAKILEQVCKFLKIDSGYKFCGLNVKHGSNVGRRPGELGGRLYRMRKKIPFWIHIARHLSTNTIDRVKGAMQREGASNYRLTDHQREEVLHKLEMDLLALKVKYNFDIEHWGLELPMDSSTLI